MAANLNVKERRAHPRVGVNLSATIVQPGVGLPAIRCTVVDMSSHGAGLHVSEASPPDEFTLNLTAAGSVSRKCKVVWREGTALGVEFIRSKKD
jgi:hypothetical protein